MDGITWIETLNGDFEHDIATKVVFTVISLASAILGFAVAKNIFVMLRRKSERGINSMIKYHTVISILSMPLLYGYFILTTWTQTPGDYLTSNGCYVNFYLIGFATVTMNCGNFYMSLYRYICVKHGDIMTRLGITHKVHLEIMRQIF